MINVKILGKQYTKTIIDMGHNIVARVKGPDTVTKGNLVKVYRAVEDYGKGDQVVYPIKLKGQLIGYINEISTLQKHNKPEAWIKATKEIRSQMESDYDLNGTSEWNGEIYDITWFKNGEYESHYAMSSFEGWEFNQLCITMHMEVF